MGNPVKVVVKVTTELPDGTINNFELEAKDYLVTEVLEIEYVCTVDGGPLMRPNLPPGQ